MAETTNYKMTLPTYTSSADINVLNENFKAIDNGISPFYVAILNSRNVYKITTGLKLTSLSNGFSIKVAIPSDSDTTYTYMKLIVDNCGEILIKKPNGNNLVNFKANGVYNLTYYNSVFICASGSVDDVSFTSDKLLAGYSANDSNGEKVDGTMVNKSAITSGSSIYANNDAKSIYCRIPQGGYITNATSGYPEISYTFDYLSSVLGITSDKLIDNTTICGIKGNISSKGSITDNISLSWDNTYIYSRIPRGAYLTNATSGYPEIKTKFTEIADKVGLTPNKIVGSIGGVVGTYKSSENVFVYASPSIQLPDTREDVTIIDCPFEPSIIVTNSKSETNYTFVQNNATSKQINWGNGNGYYFSVKGGGYPCEFKYIADNRTSVKSVTYSNGKLTINSKGSYGGSNYGYSFMIIAMR